MIKPVIDPLKAISQFLGRNGVLARELPGYEYREEQLRMAGAVLKNLQDSGILMVEAGTGTGKTLAYLVPALLSNQRVVISTGTKNLQEQIFFKDLPVLQKHFSFKAVMMKGRANYLCWRRFHKFMGQPRLEFIDEGAIVAQLRAWAEQTQTGDREELIELAEGHPVWEKIASNPDLCLSSNCPHSEECFVSALRSRAAVADIIVVNHHLFFADLSIRRLGFGEVIPRYNAVIFDEAHLLEDIITDYFGVTASDKMASELGRDLGSELSGLKKVEHKELAHCAHRIENLSDNFFPGLRRHLETSSAKDEAKKVDFLIDQVPGPLVRSGAELVRELAHAGSILSDKKESQELMGMGQRASKMAADLDFLLRQDEKGYVFYGEFRPRSLILRASPISVSKLLQEIFYPNLSSIIFTSATLTVSANKKPSFDYFKSRMGLDSSATAKELWLKSSFDWKSQALLYLPQDLPAPDAAEFVPRSAAVMEQLLELSRGRAFLLFTSYRHLDAFSQLLAPRLKYPVLIQGDKPRSELLNEFRRVEASVLFATTSFWQGVDVVGPSLSLVVIDRLPFDSPGDPLIKARIGHLKAEGGKPFYEYQVPSAVIMLRQGLGRLIRSRKDRGALCILDPRVSKKSYGKIFLDSLPEIPRTLDLNQVADFFKKERA